MTLIPVLYVGGLGLGIAAGLLGAFDMFAPWLLLAYALFFLTFLLHRFIGAPWFERMTRLSAQVSEGDSSAIWMLPSTIGPRGGCSGTRSR